MSAAMTILYVEDSAICREPIAATLRLKGYHVVCAANGVEAMAAVEKMTPALILLDVSMPQMDGLTFLGKLRADPNCKEIPVILLTAVAGKEQVLRAKQLGVQDYLLKAHFSLAQMLERIQKYLGPKAKQGAGPTAAQKDAENKVSQVRPMMAVPAPASAGAAAATDGAAGDDVPRLLTREQLTERVAACAQGRTLAGVVAEVIALASSPRGNMADLAEVLKKDPVLASSVVHVANSAAFATQKPRIATVDEAVRNIGADSVRKIASTVGIFESFPPDAKDGFNEIRSWQHSFAVAAVLDRIVAAEDPVARGMAHLVGLCHDLGEIVLRQAFAEEYATVVEVAARTGKPRSAVESIVLGMPHHDLVTLILNKIALPAGIAAPIREFHERAGSRTASAGSQLAQCLRIADHYAHGLLLAASTDALVTPVLGSEWRSATGSDQTPTFADEDLRSEVLVTTNLLGRLGAEDTHRLCKPIFPRTQARVWYARHPALVALDPVAAALKLLAETDVHDSLPGDVDELREYDGLVIVAPRAGGRPFTYQDVASLRQRLRPRSLPVLYLSGAVDGASAELPGVSVGTYPLPISALAEFVAGLKQAQAAAA